MAPKSHLHSRGLLDVDPVPILAASHNPAISFLARRDLLAADVGAASALWDLPPARKIVSKQRPDGSWRYPGGESRIRSRRNYDQLETFRQAGVLVEKLAFTASTRR